MESLLVDWQIKKMDIGEKVDQKKRCIDEAEGRERYQVKNGLRTLGLIVLPK